MFLLILKVPRPSENTINGQMLGTDFTNNCLKTQAIEFVVVVVVRERMQTYYILCNKL